MIRIFFSIFICLSLYTATAQSDFSKADAYVSKLGSLDSLNVATIADTLTSYFESKEDKARAIFTWIARNIALDPKAIRSNDNKKTDPVQVIQMRKSTSVGFALLFQEMCSIAEIRCLSVDGFTKNSADDINNPADEFNHSWNVVQLGQSPDKWYYVDAAKGSGYLDKKQSVFTPKFNSTMFFTKRTLFNLDHFPDNNAWQLGDGPKAKKDFYALPVLLPGAYPFGLTKLTPATGFVKTKLAVATKFSFQTDTEETISSVELIIGEGNKQLKPEPMNFDHTGSTLSFSYKFKKDDSFPVTILINGQPSLQYQFEVVE
jgi:hypothetical protein